MSQALGQKEEKINGSQPDHPELITRNIVDAIHSNICVGVSVEYMCIQFYMSCPGGVSHKEPAFQCR